MSSNPTALKRSLTTPLLTLYGLGVTIGAGIYVLVGEAAAKAGVYAPVSFLLAAFVVAFSGFSYSELGTRYPVSAGEAAYVRSGFRSSPIALLVGMMVAASGVVSSAAISIGAAGYLRTLIPLDPGVLTFLVIATLGLIAIWGITESITLAGLFTLIEIGGLLLVVGFAVSQNPDIGSRLGELVPPMTGDAWPGIFSAVLLAFFAFVGFEDIANVAEEVKDPRRSMPRAILWTLVLVTVIYLIVTAVVVLTVPMETLIHSEAPLAAIFAKAGAPMATLFNVIASVATINGVLVMMIMATRVLYGLADQGSLPRGLAYVHPRTRTPVIATGIVVLLILGLAFLAPVSVLAEATSQIVLAVFFLVNLALIAIKRRAEPVTDAVFQVPMFVPILGAIGSAALLTVGLL